MKYPYSVADHWQGDFDEAGLGSWASGLREKLGDREVSLGLVFMAPRFFEHAEAILEVLQVHAHVPLLAGCSSTSLVCNGQELEDQAGLTLGLYALPRARLRAVHFTQSEVQDANSRSFWPVTACSSPAQ